MSCGCSKIQDTNVCNCKLLWINGTDVSMIDSETWEIRSDLPTTVASADSSVTVVETINNTPDGKNVQLHYDLSVECCDSKVAVCAWDTNPWPLAQKLISASDIITLDVNCGDKIEIGVDEAKLLAIIPDPVDEKVGWLAWCDPQYLNDILWLTDELAFFDSEDRATAQEVDSFSYCDKRYIWLSCNDCYRKSISKARLTKNFLNTQKVGNNDIAPWLWFYVLTSNNVNWTFFPGIPTITADVDSQNAQWIGELQYGWIDFWAADGVMTNTCDIPRIVTVTFRWSIEASRWVNGIRAQVYKSYNGNTTVAWERRDSPISDPDATGDWLPDNYRVTAAWEVWNKLNQWYKYQERQTFIVEETILLEPGAKLFPVIKISSVNNDPDYDITRPAEFAILGELWSDWSVSWDKWALFQVKTEDDPCMIREIVADCNC